MTQMLLAMEVGDHTDCSHLTISPAQSKLASSSAHRKISLLLPVLELSPLWPSLCNLIFCSHLVIITVSYWLVSLSLGLLQNNPLMSGIIEESNNFLLIYLSAKFCCLGLGFIALMKHHDQKRLGKEMVDFAHTPISQLVTEGGQGRNLEEADDTEAKEEYAKLACFSRLVHPIFLQHPDAQDDTTYNGLGPPHQSLIKRMPYRLAYSPIL